MERRRKIGERSGRRKGRERWENVEEDRNRREERLENVDKDEI